MYATIDKWREERPPSEMRRGGICSAVVQSPAIAVTRHAQAHPPPPGQTAQLPMLPPSSPPCLVPSGLDTCSPHPCTAHNGGGGGRTLRPVTPGITQTLYQVPPLSHPLSSSSSAGDRRGGSGGCGGCWARRQRQKRQRRKRQRRGDNDIFCCCASGVAVATCRDWCGNGSFLLKCQKPQCV